MKFKSIRRLIHLITSTFLFLDILSAYPHLSHFLPVFLGHKFDESIPMPIGKIFTKLGFYLACQYFRLDRDHCTTLSTASLISIVWNVKLPHLPRNFWQCL